MDAAHVGVDSSPNRQGQGNKWKCEECGDIFRCSSNLHSHRQTHGSLFQCPHCPTGFIGQSHLRSHLKRTHGKILLELDAKYTCHLCQTGCGSEAKLQTHVRVVHGKGNSVQVTECDQCPETFPYPSILALHKTGHGPGFQCPHCPGQFRLISTLRLHSRRIHIRQERVGGYRRKDLWAQCHLCKVHFESFLKLGAHCSREHPSVVETKAPAQRRKGGIDTDSEDPLMEEEVGGEAILGLDTHHHNDFVVEEGVKVKVEPGSDCDNLDMRFVSILDSRPTSTSASVPSRPAVVGHSASRCPVAGVRARKRRRVDEGGRTEISEIDSDDERFLEQVEMEVPQKIEGNFDVDIQVKLEEGLDAPPFLGDDWNGNIANSGEEEEVKLFDCEVFVKSEEPYGITSSSEGRQLDPSNIKVNFGQEIEDQPSFNNDIGSSSTTTTSSDTISNTERRRSQNSTWKCDECGLSVPNAHKLHKHQQKHGIGAKCPHCPAEFSLNAYLIAHKKRMHSDILLQEENRFRCEYCQKPCGSEKNLENHVRSMHRDRIPIESKICEDCGEDFTTRAGVFESHKRTHGPGFKCSHCPAEFIHFDPLRAHHIRIHSKAKLPPPTTKRLSLRIGRRRQLTSKRVRVKEAVKNHPCDECKELFASQGHLTRHKSCHGGGFMCDHCGAGFWYKVALQQHQKWVNETAAAEAATAPSSIHDRQTDKPGTGTLRKWNKDGNTVGENKTQIGMGSEKEDDRFLKDEHWNELRVGVKMEVKEEDGRGQGQDQTVDDESQDFVNNQEFKYEVEEPEPFSLSEFG